MSRSMFVLCLCRLNGANKQLHCCRLEFHAYGALMFELELVVRAAQLHDDATICTTTGAYFSTHLRRLIATTRLPVVSSVCVRIKTSQPKKNCNVIAQPQPRACVSGAALLIFPSSLFRYTAYCASLSRLVG